MKNDFEARIKELFENRKWRRKLYGIVSVFVLTVFLLTTYAMVLPASTKEGETYCGKAEHTEHTAECYNAAGELVCDLPIHYHTLGCFSDPSADLETEEKWADSIASVELTGNNALDVLFIAKSQIGISESTLNYQVQSDGTSVKGITRYGQWYGKPYDDWSAMFASFCIRYAGLTDFPIDSDCAAWVETLTAEDSFHSDDRYEAKAGDLVFFDRDGDGCADHVGIISQANGALKNGNGKFTAVEGDWEGKVAINEYRAHNERIVGFAEIPGENEAPEYMVMSCGEENFALDINYTWEAHLPEEAYVSADEILPESEEYEARLEELEEMKDNDLPFEFVRFFDISIMDGETEIEPSAPVEVVLELEDLEVYEGLAVGAVHFGEDGTEYSCTKTSVTEDGKLLVSFEQFGFSDTGIYAISLLDAGEQPSTAWERVTDLSQINTTDKYMIVSSDGHALGYVSSALTAMKASMEEFTVNGRTYYYCSGDANSDYYRFNFGTAGTGGTVKNVADPTGGLKNGYGNFRNITLSKSGDYWRITYSSSGNTRYYIYDDGSFSTGDRYSSGRNMIIYRQVSVAPEDDPVIDDPNVIIEKPDYPDYIVPSGAQTGKTSVGEVQGTYYSDPATSMIEDLFDGDPADDGMVMVDKSVIYGADDYDAFETYDPNTFGVALSALGQKYAINAEVEVSAPLDVVFILDVSGSMIHTVVNGKTSANIMMESLNNAMQAVLDSDPDNRVGVACYSGSSTELLPLGRYTATDADRDGVKEFFDEGKWTDEDVAVKASDSLKYQNGGSVNKGSYTGGWYGTYTQEGIAQGAEIFFNEEETTITRTAEKELEDSTLTVEYTVARRPIIVLLSDGEPTYCTEEYDNVLKANSGYGSGNTGYSNKNQKVDKSTNNNKGIMGYYTILSAEYYKRQVSQHYSTDAFFYTLGIGINSTGNNSFAKSVAGDDYKRAVLNPTEDNINDLAKCTAGITESSAVNSNNNSISSYVDVTCRMLNQLLNNKYTAETVTVGSSNDKSVTAYGLRHTMSNSVPVIKNPYINSGYDYADDAFITRDATVSTLTDALKRVLNYTKDMKVYGFILRKDTSVSISDTIGDGMEVKSDLILRYGGTNYKPTGSETNGNTVRYYYDYIYRATDGSGIIADLRNLYTQVVTDENGTQTVSLYTPDFILPTYSPSLSSTGETYFYFESLPVRLLYQVGLTEESEKAVIDMDGTGETMTFYTNAWDENGENTISKLYPTSYNPYYNRDGYVTPPVVKTENTTETFSYVRQYDTTASSVNIHQDLGNNGKLVFTSEKYTLVPLTLVKVDEDGKPITSDKAAFALYKDTLLMTEPVIYETDKNGKLTIPKLRTGVTYYLKEISAPDDYALLEDPVEIIVNEDETITLGEGTDERVTITTENEMYVMYVTNDEGATEKTVEKVWAGRLAEGENYPVEVKFRLLADGEPYRETAVCNEENNWTYTWESLPLTSRTDGHTIEYTVKELDVSEEYIPYISVGDNGEIIFTNYKVSSTSVSVLKKWVGNKTEPVQVELLKNGKTTGMYATLNESNGWYYRWDDLPDADEEGAIEYSVRELVPEGFESEIHFWEGPGDPWGQTSFVSVTQATGFTSGNKYLIVYDGKALAQSENGNTLTSVEYNKNTVVTDRMLWTATYSSYRYTLTNVATGKRLSRSSSTLSLADSGSTFSYSNSNKRLSTPGNYSTTYYFTGIGSDGTGSLSTSSGDSAAVTLYSFSTEMTEDNVEKGDVHYIIRNTPTQIPDELEINVLKVNSGSTRPVLNAKLALYRETGDPKDTLIPQTKDRYGILVKEWVTDSTTEKITVDHNGDYYLVELETPEFYEGLEGPIILKVSSADGKRTATIEYKPDENVSYTDGVLYVPNTPEGGYKMPETGGTGTLPFILAGLVITAYVFFVTVRRKENRA